MRTWCIYLKREDMLKVVCIPTLKEGIFTSREEKVSISHKLHTHDTLIMSKDRLMTITKVKTPDTNVLICRATDKERTVLQDKTRNN